VKSEGVRVLLATGGSGGHIYPALAVAGELERRGAEAVFVGQARGMEARLVGETPYAFYGVRAGKWDRTKPDPRQAWQAVMGVGDAYRIVKRLRPQVALGFGGFASFPGLAGALRSGVPFALHEQNAFPGRVTRWLQGRARLIATAQAEVHARLPRARRLEHVGMPIREIRVPRREARAQLGLAEDGKLALVMGGSQGSLSLNRAVPAAYRGLPPEAREDLTVLHSSGPRWEDGLTEKVADLPHYHVSGWVDSVLAWSAADLAITRAGTGTLAEAAFHGVPLLMVPLPWAAEDHQTHNARAVAAAGAGRIVSERELGTLAAQWQALLDDRVLEAAAAAALARAPAGAAARLAELLLELAGAHSQTHSEVQTAP
jgi:UDP-N-acetylglucosamine--N-acetylmuramyl-(pentapeptide) pyrophosphoryl-undecaprenol N-acetylglucosamine transferase